MRTRVISRECGCRVIFNQWSEVITGHTCPRCLDAQYDLLHIGLASAATRPDPDPSPLIDYDQTPF
jgi:hypothetical protein